MFRSFFLALALAALFPLIAVAQSSKLSIGFEGGAGIRMLTGSSFVREFYDPSAGGGGGLAIQYQFSEYMSMRTGVMVERKGGAGDLLLTDEFGSAIGNGRVALNFDYVSLPVLARFSTGKSKRFFANVGPSFGYLAQAIGRISGTNTPSDGNTDILQSYNRFDVDALAGFGLEFDMGKRAVSSIEWRNSIGLWNTSIQSSTQQLPQRVNSALLLVGVRFALGGGKSSE